MPVPTGRPQGMGEGERGGRRSHFEIRHLKMICRVLAPCPRRDGCICPFYYSRREGKKKKGKEKKKKKKSPLSGPADGISFPPTPLFLQASLFSFFLHPPSHSLLGIITPRLSLTLPPPQHLPLNPPPSGPFTSCLFFSLNHSNTTKTINSKMRFFTTALVALSSLVALAFAGTDNPISSPGGNVVQAGKPFPIVWAPTLGIDTISLELRKGISGDLKTINVIASKYPSKLLVL